MSIQKKILPLFGLLLLTQNHGLANWWEAAKNTAEKAATGAWNEKKGTIESLVTPGAQALEAGAEDIVQGGNFNTATQDAETAFQTGQAQPAALKKVNTFYALPTTTVAQKHAIQTLYQQQKYTEVVTIVDKTGEIFTMLARTPDAVKTTNENNLTQMSQAFNEVTSANILNVTNSVYKFIKDIAPAAPAGTATTGVNSMSEAEFEKKVIKAVEKEYGALLQQVATMIKQSGSQTNIFATQTQPTNNMFMSAANG